MTFGIHKSKTHFTLRKIAVVLLTVISLVCFALCAFLYNPQSQTVAADETGGDITLTSAHTNAGSKYFDSVYRSMCLIPVSQIANKEANGGETGAYTLEKAFDGQDGNGRDGTYWQSATANSATFLNAVTVTFTESVMLESIQYKNLVFNTGGGKRNFWGYPTLLNVYTATGDNEFVIVGTCSSTPLTTTTATVNVVFTLPQAVSCDKVKLEWAEISESSFGAKACASEISFFKYAGDFFSPEKATGNYADANWLNLNAVANGDMTTYCNGGGTLSNAFDRSPSSYWVSESVNDAANGFANKVTVKFDNSKTLESVVLFLGYNTSGNNRNFWGYPKMFKVYASESGATEDLKVVSTYFGMPGNDWDRAVFRFPEAVTCKRMVLEFSLLTDNNDKNAPNGVTYIGDIMFIQKPDANVSELSDIFVDYSQTELKAEYNDQSIINELREEAKKTGNYDSAYKPILDRADAIISGVLRKDGWREFSTEEGAANIIGQYGNAQAYARNVLKWRNSPTNRQVTGLGGTTGETITIYVEADEGVTQLPQIAFTQIVGRWQIFSVTRNLAIGKNEITFPDFSYGCSVLTMGKGGPIHIINPYTREEQGGDVRVYIEGGYNYPVFRDGDDEESFKVILKDYYKRLKDPNDKTITVDCFEEIGGNLMGSITATMAYDYFINKGVSVQANLSEWIRCLNAILTFTGVNMEPGTEGYNPIVEHMPVNFRACQPYAGFFAFAAGDHIGLPGAGTYATLCQKPKNQSWAMHHEFGHMIDLSGGRTWAEYTNNVIAIYDTYMLEEVFNERIQVTAVATKLASDFSSCVTGKDHWMKSSNNCDIWWIIEGGHPGYWANSENLFRYNALNGVTAIPTGSSLGITEKWVYYASLATGDDMSQYFERWAYYFIGDSVYNASHRFTVEGASQTFKDLMAAAKADGRITGGYKKYWYVNVEQYRQEFQHGGKLDASWAACYDTSQTVTVLKAEKTSAGNVLTLPEPASKQSHLCYEIQGFVNGEWKVLGVTYTDIYTDTFNWGTEEAKYRVYAYDRMLNCTGDPVITVPQEPVTEGGEPQRDVCRIGETYYNSLREAVAAASAGDTIYLMKDFSDSGIGITNKNLTIVPDDSIPADGAVTITKNAAGNLITVSGSTVKFGNADKARIILDGNGFSQSGTLYHAQGANTINNVTFRNNKTTGNGGALCVGYSSNVILLNSTIEDNSAANGGGIYTQGNGNGTGNLLGLFNVVIRNNVAANNGGGIYHSDYQGKCRIANDTSNPDPNMTRLIIQNNRAKYGGGIYTQNRICNASGSDTKPLKNLQLLGNTATVHGGGIYFASNRTDMPYNAFDSPVIKDNTAENPESSAIYFNAGQTQFTGGIIEGGIYKNAVYDFKAVNSLPDFTNASFTCPLSAEGTPIVNSVTGVDLTDEQVIAAIAAIKVVNGHTVIAGTAVKAVYSVAEITYVLSGEDTGEYKVVQNYGSCTLSATPSWLGEKLYIVDYVINGESREIGGQINIEGDMTISVKVKRHYAVILVYETNAETIYVMQDSEYYLPMSTPDGKVIFGWDCSDGNYYAYARGVRINRDTVFTAVIKRLFTVSFTVEGVTATAEYDYGNAIVLTEPAKVFGKVFKGWKIGDKIYRKDSSLKVTENINAVAVFEDKWTVIFVAGDAETTAEHHNGEEITLEKPADDAGRVFRYWQLNGAKYYAGAKYTVTGDALFVAVYTTGAQNITMTTTVNISGTDQNGEVQESRTSTNSTHAYGSTITLGTPSKPNAAWASNMKFVYWNINEVLYEAGATLTATESFEAVAMFYSTEDAPVAAKYTVTVIENHNGAETTSAYAYTRGEEIFFYQPKTAVAGKAFAYWQIGEDKYAVGDVYTVVGDVTVTAVYGNIYTVTIKQVNGETTAQYGAGRAFVLPKAPKADGKLFSHWLVGEDEYREGDTFAVENDVTVQAVYIDVPKHKVVIAKYENGVLQSDEKTYVLGSVIVLPQAEAKGEGQEFEYYDVNGIRYSAGAKLTVLEDATVIAVYKAATGPVSPVGPVDPGESDKPASNAGLIVGLVVSGVVVLGGAGFCVWVFVIRKKKISSDDD